MKRMKMTRVLSWLAMAVLAVSLLPTRSVAAAGTMSYFPFTINTSTVPNTALGNAVWGATETYQTWSSAAEYSDKMGMDDAAAFYASSRNSSGGFPANGAVTVDGVTYQLMAGNSATAYDNKDCIRLPYNGTADMTLTAADQGKYANVYIFATVAGINSGSYAIFQVTLRYATGKDDVVTYRLYDWYDNRSNYTVADNGGVKVTSYPNFKRITAPNYLYYPGANKYDGSTTNAPFIHSAMVPSDPSRTLIGFSFQVSGHGENWDASLYEPRMGCGIFAITGAKATSAPAAPVAVAATSVATGASPSFTANWFPALGAQSYQLQVATDTAFSNIVYSNNSLSSTTLSATVNTGLNAGTYYYYRLRAVNEYDASGYSNIIGVPLGLPKWLTDAGLTTSNASYSFSAGNVVTITGNATLTGPLVVPAGETTTINLGGKTLNAAAEQPAITGVGANTKLKLTGSGSILGSSGSNSTTGNAAVGSPAIDFSSAGSGSSVQISGSSPSLTVTGGNGGSSTSATGSGGTGGSAVIGNVNTMISLTNTYSRLTGGHGGSAAGGTGGDGGMAVAGSSVSNAGGWLTGGNGGNSTERTGTAGAGGLSTNGTNDGYGTSTNGLPGNAPPNITTMSLPNALLASGYSQTLAATGYPVATWSISQGSLPTGLSLNPTSGVISGNPSTAGTYTFTAKAANSMGNHTKQYSVTVYAALAVDITGTKAIVNGQSTELTANVTGGIGPYSYDWTIPPSTATLGTSSKLTVQPTANTIYQVTVTDQSGTTKTANANVTVAAQVCTIALSQSGTHSFIKKTAGYTDAELTPLTVTVSNTGNVETGALSVALSGSDTAAFLLSKTSLNSIGVGSTDRFTVEPATNLTAGEYAATVTVGPVESRTRAVTAQTFHVSFVVDEPLSEPTGLAWGGATAETAAWTAVTNAVGYTVRLYQGGTTDADQIEEVDTVTCTVDFADEMKRNDVQEQYFFKVMAVGNHTTYTDSPWATSDALHFVPSYTVTYQTNGGAGFMANDTALLGTPFVLPACTFTAPAGRQFKAWAVGSAIGTAEAAGSKLDITADTELYAIWEDTPTPTLTDPAADKTITAVEGTTAVFSVTSPDATDYQWFIDRKDGKGFQKCLGATGASYTTHPVEMVNDGYRYYCRAYLGIRYVDSPTFTLHVVEPPEIPKTGDAAMPWLWAGLLLLAAAGLTTDLLLRRGKCGKSN